MGFARAILHNKKKLSTAHVDIDKTCNCIDPHLCGEHLPHIQRNSNNTLRPRAEQRQRRRWYMR
eukprot:scaffold420424_cov24-Attheya_sp.AAC.1